MIPARTFLGLSSSRITPEMEEVFFTSIMARNGTYKTTYGSRFSEINEQLLRLISVGSISARSVLDVGISSGVNTLELAESLGAHGYEASIVGTDILIDAYLVRVLPGCDALVDASGFPLRFDLFGRSMKPWVVQSDYRSGLFLVRKGINVLFRSLAARVRAGRPNSKTTQVQLVSPRLLEDENIVVCDDDITRFNPEFAARFDLVRAANVLNKGYFDDGALRGIIGNIRKYLKPAAGSLLVLRTHENKENHGTLFTLDSDNRFVLLERFGTGSEIEHLVLEV